MTEMTRLTPGLAAATGTADAATPRKLEDAARQFESLLMTQLLRAAHSDDSGWFGTGGGEDAAGGQAMEIGEEFLAQSITQNGGLGIARMIAKELK